MVPRSHKVFQFFSFPLSEINIRHKTSIDLDDHKASYPDSDLEDHKASDSDSNMEDHKASDSDSNISIFLWIQVCFRKSSILILDDSI